MKRIFFLSFSIVFAALLLVECGKYSVTGQNNQKPLTDNGGNHSGYNQSDTNVNLQNGRLTLDIPAGDLKNGITISISPSNAAFVDTSDLLHQFELKPHWDIGFAYKNNQDGKWYPALKGKVNTVKHTIYNKTL
jgi:hypothetical protein